MEDDEINMLKYYHPKKVVVGDQYKKIEISNQGVKRLEFALDDDGNRIKLDKSEKEVQWLEERWVGYCRATRKSYTLTTEFVEQNFSAGYIEQVKKLAEKGKRRFIKVPPGSDKRHELLPTTIQNAPVMKFRQAEGERTCLSYSFASALHHAGAKQIALEVFCMSNKITEKHNTISYFIDMFRKTSKPLIFTKLKVRAWNILENEENNLVVVLLRGSDGKEDHCVTLFGKWIFDSNFKNALPLTKEYLDLCCSLDKSAEQFVEVVQALMCSNYMYMIHKKNQKKRKRKN